MLFLYFIFASQLIEFSSRRRKGGGDEEATRENKSRVKRKEKDADCASVGRRRRRRPIALRFDTSRLVYSPIRFVSRGLDYIHDARKSDQRLFSLSLVYAAAIAPFFFLHFMAVFVLREAQNLSSFNVSGF